MADARDHRQDGQTPQLTIEQFAAETGMSQSNIRSYRSRHLIQAPVIRDGVGYYGDEHIARVRRIVELQAQGLKLSEIEQLLAGRRPSVEQLAELAGVISAPFEIDPPEVLTRDQLTELVGPTDEGDIAKAQQLGLLIAAGDRTFETPSPALLRAIADAVARGVPVTDALNVIEQVRRNCEQTSATFIQLFVDHVWTPFDQAGLPNEQWHEVTSAIEELRQLASEVLLAVFKQTMEAEIERAFSEIAQQLAARSHQPNS
ncbi:MAG: MerR family transcriptional regulator [Conexibacteraceae bacterium]|nr:MerR family transcriptional regulator [Conexibacteraceae bacterium]